MRAREAGYAPGTFDAGPHNAITDVAGVRVGHVTVRHPPQIHTGVTAILPGDVTPRAPLPAGFCNGNGYGKFIGATQIAELGEIESPIVLTSTLSAFRAADALVSWMLRRDDLARIRSFNPVVGECNDGFLSDIRARPVGQADVLRAIESACGGAVPEGAVGAGTGMMALGFKAGIGTASRVVADHRVASLVLANFAGTLRVGGRTVPAARQQDTGSCVIVVITDAPLDARQLSRVARRAVYGLGRIGAAYSHGSGDYGLAVSMRAGAVPLRDNALSPYFEATMDCVEESVLNSLLAATPVTGFNGHTAPGLQLDMLTSSG